MTEDDIDRYLDFIPPEWSERTFAMKHVNGNRKPLSHLLSEIEQRYIAYILDENNKGQPSGAITKALGISTGTALKIRQKLVAEGYVKEHRVNRHNRGRAAI